MAYNNRCNFIADILESSFFSQLVYKHISLRYMV